jgi:hypothetical protein
VRQVRRRLRAACGAHVSTHLLMSEGGTVHLPSVDDPEWKGACREDRPSEVWARLTGFDLSEVDCEFCRSIIDHGRAAAEESGVPVVLAAPFSIELCDEQGDALRRAMDEAGEPR